MSAGPDEPDVFELQARFCGIFSNPARLRILALLADGERSVGDLADHLGLSMPAVSQHLQIMKDRRAVAARREGRSVFYRITNEKFLRGSRLIREGILEELRRSGRHADALEL
jgi:DNA-binding transcriptional ArsR family regulator